MKKTSIALLTSLLALMAGTAPPSFAHGDGHVKKAGSVRQEQKDWGIAGKPSAVRRTITVRMGDNMRFTPDTIDVKQGETIRLLIRNDGQVLHEMVIGTQDRLQEHAALMLRFPGMEHDEPYMAHVGPGKAGEIIWTFNRPGSFDFACLVAGHYQAGMTGKINVATR